jgi:glutamate-5-semialdehyde dehydrogenase
MNSLFQKAQDASIQLAQIDNDTINQVLNEIADAAIAHTDEILAANAKDLAQMSPDNPLYDRLKLTKERLEGIASDTRHVATLPSPLGKVLKHYTLPNGLDLSRISVPFGVIGIIYEARPNVTFDVAALCLKSGNACVLKGGKDADNSNQAIVLIIKAILQQNGINPDAVTLLPATHEATTEMLHANGFIDLVIPRGSSRLIQYVRQNSTVPVIETGAGICHCYFDEYGDLEKGKAIVNNAKTRRVSVCNALDCLIINAERLPNLPALCAPLADSNVTIYADEPAYALLEGNYPSTLLCQATDESFGTEFLDYKMAIKTVSTFDEALAHIRRYSSRHSESIVTEDTLRAEQFIRQVDAACVYTNAPTSFTDGAQFGLGAEIGISTQKLHARGPMALEEITTYKWVIRGNGQTRPK